MTTNVKPCDHCGEPLVGDDRQSTVDADLCVECSRRAVKTVRDYERSRHAIPVVPPQTFDHGEPIA